MKAGPARALEGAAGVLVAWVLLASGCATTSAEPRRARPPKPVSLRLHVAQAEPRDGYRAVVDELGQTLYVAPDSLVTERDVRHASVYENPQRSLILLEFKPVAAARLADAAAEPTGRRLAVFVDGELIMSPPLRGPLGRGRVFLDGRFSAARAAEIARGLNVPPATRRETTDAQADPALPPAESSVETTP